MGLGSFEIESFEICCRDNQNRSCFLAQAFRSNMQSTGSPEYGLGPLNCKKCHFFHLFLLIILLKIRHTGCHTRWETLNGNQMMKMFRLMQEHQIRCLFLSIKESVSPADWPVFEKQCPENTGSVLSSDLIRDDHRLHHQMGDAGQSVLLQVQKDGT